MFPQVRCDEYNAYRWFGWKKWSIFLGKENLGWFILNNRLVTLFPFSIEDKSKSPKGITWFDNDYGWSLDDVKEE